jgi:hypothetical protein
VVANLHNPSTQEVEAGGSQVPGQPRLYSEKLSQKNEKKEKKKTLQRSVAL